MKMETTSKPEISRVKRELFNIILGMHDSLKNIERVDKLVFPLLQLDYPKLNRPDVKNNEMLKLLIKTIEKIIDEGLINTEIKLEEIAKFNTVYERKTENIIAELKKKSFAQQNHLDSLGSDQDDLINESLSDISSEKSNKKEDKKRKRKVT
jgi:hypothetical protein